jgi:hypothetical protein
MSDKIFILAGPWAPKMTTLFEDELKPRMKAGTITPPLVVTAQQNGDRFFYRVERRW